MPNTISGSLACIDVVMRCSLSSGMIAPKSEIFDSPFLTESDFTTAAFLAGSWL